MTNTRTISALALAALLAATSSTYATSYIAVSSGQGASVNTNLFTVLPPTLVNTFGGGIPTTDFEYTALADFNGDGIPDVVTSDVHHPGVLVQNGSTHATILNISLTGGPVGNGAPAAAADVNGDGIPDVISSPNFTGTAFTGINVYSGVNGSLLNSFSAAGNALAAADFNHDGHADIVAGGTVYSGATLAPLFTFPDTGGISLATGDYNHDGTPDIAVGTASTINIYSGIDQHLLESFNPFSASTTGISVALADFNGDGFADIIAGSIGQTATQDGNTFSSQTVSIFDGLTLAPLVSNFSPVNGNGAFLSVAAISLPEPASLTLLALGTLPLLRRKR